MRGVVKWQNNLQFFFGAFIYGEVIGYVLSALSGSPFEPLQSGLIAMVGGFIAVNCLLAFVKSPKKRQQN